jgi:hypothetical protein
MNIIDFIRPADPNPDTEAAAEPEDGRGAPPDTIPHPKGLTAARAALQRHCWWIEAVEADLARLRSGKERLEGDVAKVEGARAKVARGISQGARAILDSIRGGKDYSLGSAISLETVETAAAADASSTHLGVAQAALTETEAEIGRLETLLSTLQARKPRLIAAAVREAAQGLYDDYRTAQDNLRDAMVQLAGLDAALGATRPGRLVAVVPDLQGSSGLDELPILAPPAAVADAAGVWRSFAAALSKDPGAPASLIEFNPIDPNAPDDVVYDRMHPLERRLVDLKFSKGN